MGFGARLPGTKLTLLSPLRAASRAPYRQCLFLSHFHESILHVCWEQKMFNFDQRIVSMGIGGWRTKLFHVTGFMLLLVPLRLAQTELFPRWSCA